MICVCLVILSCLLLAALWSPAGERALLALLYVTFSCVFVTFTHGVLGPMWYLIASIPLTFALFLTLKYIMLIYSIYLIV